MTSMHARETDPSNAGIISFTPLYAPNVFFLTVFILLFIGHIGLATRYWRFYGYTVGIICGLLLEFLGYLAKVHLSRNREDKSSYIMYIIGLTLGPTFLSASLYLGVKRLQRRLKTRIYRILSPAVMAAMFMVGDFACLCFIGVGGSLAAIYANEPIGVDLMITGLALQVLFTAIFCMFLARAWQMQCHLFRTKGVLGFFIASVVAASCLLIRSCWRAIELSGGFNGPLTSQEGIFIVLDSVPMVLFSVLLTLMHPGFLLGAKDHYES